MDTYEYSDDSFESFTSELADLCMKYGCVLHFADYSDDKRVVFRMPSHWFSDYSSPVIKFF